MTTFDGKQQFLQQFFSETAKHITFKKITKVTSNKLRKINEKNWNKRNILDKMFM